MCTHVQLPQAIQCVWTLPFLLCISPSPLLCPAHTVLCPQSPSSAAAGEQLCSVRTGTSGSKCDRGWEPGSQSKLAACGLCLLQSLPLSESQCSQRNGVWQSRILQQVQVPLLGTDMALHLLSSHGVSEGESSLRCLMFHAESN